MPSPKFALVKDPVLRGRIEQFRDSVTHILAGNYLPSFTDHSVNHSDELCAIVDVLTAPLSDAHQLRDPEAFVLYLACYAHDVGMQHQRAGDTEHIRKVLSDPTYKGRRWEDLGEETHRDIVRTNHHWISGEMVRKSNKGAHPTLLGVQLNDAWYPSRIACLAEAHCLEAGSPEYKDLTADSADFRMSLLSALLRLADILDESRRRSQLFLGRTRELDLNARMHWWRHYYVTDVEFVPPARRITLWFEFPPSRRDQYRDLMIPSTLSRVKEEFGRHSEVFARHNLHWHLDARELPERQSASDPMDDELERYVAEQLAHQRQVRNEQEKLMLLRQLKEVRPTIERQLSELRASRDTLTPDQLLNRFLELAKHLWSHGGQLDAWTSLWHEYNTSAESASAEVRLMVAAELTAMMLQAGNADVAFRLLQAAYPEFCQLPDNDRRKYVLHLLYGQASALQCQFAAASQSFDTALRLASDSSQKEIVRAEVAEMTLLMGNHPALHDGGAAC